MIKMEMKAEDYASHIRVFTGHLARKSGKATLLAAADLLVAQEKRLEPLAGIDDVAGWKQSIEHKLTIAYGHLEDLPENDPHFNLNEAKKAIDEALALFPTTETKKEGGS